MCGDAQYTDRLDRSTRTLTFLDVLTESSTTKRVDKLSSQTRFIGLISRSDSRAIIGGRPAPMQLEGAAKWEWKVFSVDSSGLLVDLTARHRRADVCRRWPPASTSKARTCVPDPEPCSYQRSTTKASALRPLQLGSLSHPCNGRFASVGSVDSKEAGVRALQERTSWLPGFLRARTRHTV